MGPLGEALQLMGRARRGRLPPADASEPFALVRSAETAASAWMRPWPHRMDTQVQRPEYPRGARARVGLKAFAQDSKVWTPTTIPPSPASALVSRVGRAISFRTKRIL